MPFDLLCYRIFTWAFEKTFDLPLYWTTDEVCATISREADFKAEAQFTKQARVRTRAFTFLSSLTRESRLT
jgi:aarF domain-containing kinase